MKLLVCIKQVLDSNTRLRIDPNGCAVADGPLKYWMNHADEFAVEEGIRIREAFPGTTLDVITVGPDRAEQVLERAMGMGADAGVHIRASEEISLSPLTLAVWMAHYARERAYDLIFTGVMAEDDMQGQVGPMLAECLELPCATSVMFQAIHPERGVVYVEREIEKGRRDTLEMDLPALLTIQTGINRPRYPSLSNLIRARQQEPRVVNAWELPSVAQREKIVKADIPGKSRAGVRLEGTSREKAVQLIERLKREGLLQTGE